MEIKDLPTSEALEKTSLKSSELEKLLRGICFKNNKEITKYLQAEASKHEGKRILTYFSVGLHGSKKFFYVPYEKAAELADALKKYNPSLDFYQHSHYPWRNETEKDKINYGSLNNLRQGIPKIKIEKRGRPKKK